MSIVFIKHINGAGEPSKTFDANGGISEMIIIEKNVRFRLMVNSEFKNVALMETLTKDNKINYNVPVQTFAIDSDVVLFMLSNTSGKHSMVLKT